MPPPEDFLVVGIGASAGGVEALQTLFRAMPEPPMAAAFVVVTHIGPGRDSAMPDILKACTMMPVVPARDGDRLAPGHVYVLTNDSIISISDGKLVLRLQSPNEPRERQRIDLFFISLAIDLGERAVGIVLSGSGSDGALGLKAIKEHGGFTLAQGSDGTVPRYPSMPDSAAAGGVVDLLMPVEEMPAWLATLSHQPGPPGLDNDETQYASAPQAEPDAQAVICEILRARIGHDFSGYKSKTFFRRVQRRMLVLQLKDLNAYIGRLHQDSDEAGNLFRDLLIRVTGFFRDPESFDALARTALPSIYKAKGADDTVRIWVPGCATGEEAYSLAILATEHAAGRKGMPAVQIFATDIDDVALSVARSGRYQAALMANVSPERLARYFVAEGSTYVVSKEIRDLCVFSQHSVIRDAPFSRLDMVSCRNLLIYMGGQLQDQVIPLFHYALRPGGFLFLGVSETVSKHTDLFVADDKAHRIYRRRDTTGPGLPLQIKTASPGSRGSWQPGLPSRWVQAGSASDLRQMANAIAAEQLAPPHLLVNADGDIVYQSSNLGTFLEPSPGMPSRQLLALARFGLRMDLRSALREAAEKRRRVQRPGVDLELNGARQAVTVTVVPLPQREATDALFMVAFTVSEPAVPRQDTSDAGGTSPPPMQLVEHLESDLRETRERLQSTTEEYETVTEELKSANEEMVSVNEELQSINEELETSKEELQSVNEELRSSNIELTSKIEELDRANADLHNLFESTEIATIFLDRHLVIRSFTPAVSAIFDLIATDRGRSLISFASHLDGVDLRQDATLVLNRRLPMDRRVTAHGGTAHYLMRMLPYTTTAGEVDGVVLTFFDVTKVVERELLETLVDELNHRVRNMLMVVSAVASHTLRQAPSLEEFGKIFKGRINALAAAHELVSRGGWRAVSMLELLEKELKPYAAGAGSLILRGAAVLLKPRAAIALGMVVHEMATNAAKHGALSVQSGCVSVIWAIESVEDADHLVLRWTETGGPKITSPPERRGFGSQLMDRQLRHDLKGTLEVSFDEPGLRIVIVLPEDVIATRGDLAPRSPENSA